MVKLLALLALLQVVTVLATPTSWTSKWLDLGKPASSTCISHPETTYLGHTGPQPTDATWLATAQTITFTLTNGIGVAQTSICPTQTNDYTLTVNLPTTGLIFLTADVGDFTGSGYTKCGTGSRIAASPASYPSSYTYPFRAWCDQVANKTSVTMRVTFASGQTGQYFANSFTIPINPTCANTTCFNYVPTSPPPTPPPTPPPPPPTGTPVYPECIGAALLPNPCPLSKRCFYDTECKVQTSDLVYPNCNNAVPLANPWPTGKCCFYDSQCKPQCEDKTNSKCTALKIPACAVPGCGRCSNTSSSVCEMCWSGYVLNLVTKKCDCAPGFFGVTACKACAAGTISYGMKLGTAATCIACPTGRVANANKTECVVASAWGHWGYDLTNRRWAYNETTLTTSNVANIKLGWSMTTGLDVSATPTIVGGRMYVPDWNGNLYCLNALTGGNIWTKKISDYVFAIDPAPYPVVASNTSIMSRTSPAVSGTTLVVGVMKKGGGYPYLLAINIANGKLIWGKRVDTHVDAMMTQSPTIHAGYIYSGVSSLEELHAASPGYACCTFRGNMLKVDLATGKIIWRTYMTPDNKDLPGGFSGNSVWGSAPSVDVRRNVVYIATGNNYEIPDTLENCLNAVGNITTTNVAQALECERLYGQGNYHNSIVALDLTTGAIKWAKQLGGPDAWNGACGQKGTNPNCAAGGLFDLNSPDYDFAQAPMLVTACKASFCKQLVVAGQKSGWLWALDPESGDVHWSTSVGPGGTVGGLQWGSAADNARIYVSNNNYLSISTDLTGMKSVVNFPTKTNQRPPASTNGGVAAAVNAYDGTIEWTFANPTPHWADLSLAAADQRRARSQAPMTVANNIVFYPSMDLDGTLFMLDARTGKLLSSVKTGMTTGCGPSVVNGKVYIGSGYSNFGLGKSGAPDLQRLHMLTL